MDGNGSARTVSRRPFGEVFAPLLRFEGTPREFLTHLLSMQCELVGSTDAAIMAVDADRSVRLLVARPEIAPSRPPAWLTRASALAPDILAGGRAHHEACASENGRAALAGCMLMVFPLHGASGSTAIAAYVVPVDEGPALERAQERLEVSMGLLSLYEMRRSEQSRRADLLRLRDVMEVVTAVGEPDRARAAGMAFCNDIATRWRAERVSFGRLHGRYVRVEAISHVDKFDRRMRLVQDLEAAMEECVDQDIEVMYPAPAESATISRAVKTFVERHGPASALVLPIRRRDDVIGAVLVERPPTEPWQTDEVESLRLAVDLTTSRLDDIYRHDRWIGAKLVDELRRGFESLLGARHTWAKLTIIGLVLVVLGLTFIHGDDTIDASFEIIPIDKRIIPAPFDGRLDSVSVEPGDTVIAGTTELARLDTTDLRMRLSSLRAEHASYEKQADLALREQRTADEQIAAANLRRLEADIAWLEHQRSQATILAPISGTILTGDLRRQIGGPVETGVTLFEIAPIDELQARLRVPEDRIADLLAMRDDTATGTLASVAHPGDYLPFGVLRIEPVAEVMDQQNVFAVDVRLTGARTWLRPGMKGLARVKVGRRPYGVLWSRDIINWVRMRLWI
ncbi:MAG: HlyD family efflux transporter periplasmic adaptor subunit [Phycisphaerales bacterium]|nr:HlyD family efflux transporter periplasmic adaptor subunit [Phycisphaerales bacterium]